MSEDSGDLPNRMMIVLCILVAVLAAIAGTAQAQLTPEKRAAVTTPTESQPTEDAVSTADLKPFGFEFFAGAPSDLTIAPDAPVPDDYRLDTGDKLRIRYWTPAIPEVVHELRINDSGNVQIPDIGDVRAAGLTREEFRRKLRERLVEQLKAPSFSADLIETRTIVVFVTGSARRPGRYTVKAESNLFNVIYAAGGPSDEGSMRRVTLRRKNETVAITDLYKFLLKGVSDRDVVLKDQDTIFIPVAGARVAVKGQVVRPALYEVIDGMTVSDALDLAGGLRASAYPNILRIERFENGRRVERTLDAQAILSDRANPDNITLLNGDVLSVESVAGAVRQQVRIKGNVHYPGAYSTTRAPTAKKLLTEAQIRTGTYWERADLCRVLDDGTPVIISVPLRALLDGQSEDIPLLDQDEIVVYRSDEKAILPLVTVEGAVKNPASYRLAEGMHVSDLIFAAGGILKDAALDVAHLYRRTGPDDTRIMRVHPAQNAPADGHDNPALQADDRLVIYKQKDVDYKPDTVRVVGAVQRPGEYQACDGLTLYDLIIQAGGPTDMAAGTVEIATPVSGENSAKRASVTSCTIEEACEGLRRDHPVRPGMLISLPSRADKLREPWKVELKGRFTRPGVYALLYEGETLDSLIERAGGLCDNADPFGMSLTRSREQMLSAATNEQIRTVLNTMDQLLPSVSESTEPGGYDGVYGTPGTPRVYGQTGVGSGDAFLLVSPRRLKEMPTNSRITFSLEDKPSYLQRIGQVRLADGDIVEVPRQSEVVQVLGAVQSPGPVFYVQGYRPRDYIERAGGGAPDSDFDRAVVIRVSGTVQPLDRTKDVNPGDVIVIASKHQVIEAPRHRHLRETLSEILGVALVVRGLR